MVFIEHVCLHVYWSILVAMKFAHLQFKHVKTLKSLTLAKRACDSALSTIVLDSHSGQKNLCHQGRGGGDGVDY